MNFTITVTHTGQTPYTGTVVSTTLADVLHDAEFDGTSTASSGVLTYPAPNLSWTGRPQLELDLAAGAEATFTSTVTVMDTPPELPRLAAVACAGPTTDDSPIVCATHSDQLPAGAAAESTITAAAPSTPSGSSPSWWYLAGGGALAMPALAIFLVRRRQTPRPTQTAPTPDGAPGGGKHRRTRSNPQWTNRLLDQRNNCHLQPPPTREEVPSVHN